VTGIAPDATLAIAQEMRRRRAHLRSVRGLAGLDVDPIGRLMDPTFTETLWHYEFSRIDPDIPGKLHPKQQEALANPAVHRWLFWGNQVGKTSVGAIDMVLSALGRHPAQLAGLEPMPPFTGWASALSWELWQKILLPELLTWIPRDRVIDSPQPHVLSTKHDIVIRADNGTESRITGKAAEQGAGKYQSARVNKVWLDEEHPKAIWEEMQPRLLRHGGRTIATMTPILGLTWVYGEVYEPVKAGVVPTTRHWFSHAGIKDNPSISAASLEELRAELKNNPSQLAAREEGLFVKPIGAVLPFDIEKHGVELEGAELAAFIKRTRHYGGVDLGKWRFAFSWGGVEKFGDNEGALTLIDEVFSQNEDADTRAGRIHKQLKHYGVTDIDIWGDCADPDGLLELNQALERLHSPYHVMPVQMENKKKTAGIMRLESLMTRGAFHVRKGMGRDTLWFVGMSASSHGRPVRGSRWVWEANNWQYPKSIEGKVQKDEPDDATADGADCMDETRYLVMEWLGPLEEVKPPRALTLLERLAQEFEEMDADTAGPDESRYGPVLRQ
jgi:phage terminase large subunit-like protein